MKPIFWMIKKNKVIKKIIYFLTGLSIFYFCSPFICMSFFGKNLFLLLASFGAAFLIDALIVSFKYLEDNRYLNYTITQVKKEIDILDKKIKEAEAKRKK